MRKMTETEFIEVLKKATGDTYHGDYETILLSVLCLLHDSKELAERDAKRHRKPEKKKIYSDFAEIQQRRADELHNTLKAIGFYDRD